jgi:hypothetical protein
MMVGVQCAFRTARSIVLLVLRRKWTTPLERGSNLPVKNSKVVIGVARIGSSVRCCFSTTIEKAAEIEDRPRATGDSKDTYFKVFSAARNSSLVGRFR